MQVNYSSKNYFIEIPQSFTTLKSFCLDNLRNETENEKLIFHSVDHFGVSYISNDDDYSRYIHNCIILGIKPIITVEVLKESRFISENDESMLCKKFSFSESTYEGCKDKCETKNIDRCNDYNQNRLFDIYEDIKHCHFGTQCNGCGKTDIEGKRYKCNTCGNFDFCDSCYATKADLHKHKFTMISSQKKGFSFASVKPNSRTSTYNSVIFEAF